MTTYNKFETVYRNARLYALGKLAGSKLADQKKYDASTPEFEKLAYLGFKQDVQVMFGFEIDRNTFLFDQNGLKTAHNGRESLKSLCKGYYFEAEALYLANG
jgi:hypothetical protein